MLTRNFLTIAAMAAASLFPPAHPSSEIAGAPWKYHVIDSGLGADGARLLDVNGDGLPDIVTGWEEGGRTRAYLNPGAAASARPWPYVTVGTTGDVEDAVFADIDGDGAYDVVSASEGNTRALYIQFAPAAPADYLTGSAWTQINLNGAVGAPAKNQYMFSVIDDLNGDGRPEIIAGGKNGSQLGYFTSARGSVRSPANWTYHKMRNAGWTMSLVKHDFDRDGDLDILISDRRPWLDPAGRAPRQDARGVYWMENPGKVKLAAGPDTPWPQHAIGATGRSAMLVAVGDLNGDGRADVAAPIGDPGPRDLVLMFAQDDRGNSFKEVTLNLGTKLGDAFGYGKALSITDVDRDGKPDLVYTAESAFGAKSGVVWLSYGSNPANPDDWTAHQISGADGEKYDLAAIADLNGDGYPDVITTEEQHLNADGIDGGLGLIWYENPGRAPRRKR